MSDDGTRESQGRTGQEGQAQEGQPVELCQICQLPDGPPHSMRQHKFTAPGQAIDTRQFDRRRTRERREGDSPTRGILPPQRTAETPRFVPVGSPFDPVLRMALIDAGIITVEQLQAAERKISMFTQEVTRAE